MERTGEVRSGARQASFPLWAGVVLVPVIFAWLFLRRGYSTKDRILAFGWMFLNSALWLLAAR